MGIQGLLPLVKSTMVPIHIKELQGSRVAVDAYSWLHKGAFSCSTELCKGLPTSRHIEYCMHRVNMMRHYGVEPILVFDGGLLPMKIEQENKRARSRKENLARAIEHESNGNSAAAYECYQKALDISPSIAHELIQVLKQENVSYVVAPYEADAQMTFLALHKQVDAVITEDSDLIPFGCPRIIFKMDKHGQGVEFHYSRLQKNKELSFGGFTDGMLLEMCILSGCDYLQSLPGMGLKRAYALISKFKSYDKVIKHLRYSTASVPPLYEESFKRAMLTFRHQRVYDLMTEDIVHLSNVSSNLGEALDFLGPLIPQNIAKGIAKGDLDPFTQMPFQGDNVRPDIKLKMSSEPKNSQPENGRKKLDLPVQKNVLTKYFCFASLEAKRKFKAPRTSPVSLSVENSSPLSPREYCAEASPCEVDCSSASPLGPENVGNNHPNGSVESGFATELPVYLKSPSCGAIDEKGLIPEDNSVQKPYQATLMECNYKILADADQQKTMMGNQRDISRSSYFQNTLVTKNDEDDDQERLSGKNNVANHMFHDTILENSCKTRTANKNVTVRSRYFQHKIVDNADRDGSQEILASDTDTDTCEDTILESASSKNNHYSSITIKRKASINDTIQEENMTLKIMRADTSLPIDGRSECDTDKTVMEAKVEENKFGSNISHLGRFTGIAEKSMERFVSVISSFRYNSSGSRASGLRPPLKDIRNTCVRRPTSGMDFAQFAYVPKDRKTDSASRRC